MEKLTWRILSIGLAQLAWAAVPCGLVASVAGASGNLVAIAPGVTATTQAAPHGGESVIKVRVVQQEGDRAPDLRDLLEPAFYYCSGVAVPRDSEGRYVRGSATPHSIARFRSERVRGGGRAPARCHIEFASGTYRADSTVFLQDVSGDGHSLPIEIDFNGSSVVHVPRSGFRGTSTFDELPACTAQRRGHYYRVSDARSWMDPLRGGAREVRIAEVVAADPRATRFGFFPVRVRSSGPHGLSDGNDRDLSQIEVSEGTGQGLGDVVRIRGTAAYDGYYLVQEVVDEEHFIIKTAFDPEGRPGAPSRGIVGPAPATAWCSGSDWQSGKPVIYVGGERRDNLLGEPVKPKQIRFVTLRNFTFKFARRSEQSFFQRFVVVDSAGPGAANISLEDISSSGMTDLSGKVVVDLGGPRARNPSACESVRVTNLRADAIGGAWAAAVWNRSCSDSVLEQVHVEHGGGVWIGMDLGAGKPGGYHRPHNVKLSGVAEGIDEGPALAIWSGRGIVLSGWEMESDKDGPRGKYSRRDRGMLAIVGGSRAAPVDLVTHGSYWRVHASTDLDCYVQLGRIASWSWYGGHIEKGRNHGDSRRGKGVFACAHAGSRIGRIDWRGIEEAHSNPEDAGPVLLELGPVASHAQYVAPNVTHSYAMPFPGVALPSNPGCWSTVAGRDPEPCGTPLEAIREGRAHGFQGSRLWVHELACWHRGEGSIRPSGSLRLRVMVSEGDEWAPVGPTFKLPWTEIDASAGLIARVNAATPGASGGLVVETLQDSDPGPSGALSCQLKVSDLVE